MRKLFTAFLLSGLFALTFRPVNSQNLGFRFVNDVKEVTIPFELFNNLIVIPVILNGKLPLKFILDTGVRTTILTDRLYADMLNLPFSRKYVISGLGKNKVIEAYVCNGVSIGLPGILGSGHAMLVLQEDYLELRNYLGAEVQGVLGYELFSRFIVKIDYDQRILTLTTPDNLHLGKKWMEVPLTIEDTKPYMHAKAMYYDESVIDLKLLVDTGASHGLILMADTDSTIHVPEKNLDTSLGRGLGGRLEGKLARMRSFKMADGACWSDVVTTFPESDAIMDSLLLNTTFRNGSVGGDILSRFKVIFDFPEEKMYLRKAKQFKKAFSYNFSGIVVKAIGSNLNNFEVVEIRKNSVAEEAGIQVGDQIVMINGLRTDHETLDHVINMMNAKAGKKLHLVIMRDTERLKYTLTLQDVL